MRIFLNELQQKHRAKIGALLKRHKASIGYGILAIGLVVALLISIKGQEDSRSRERATFRHIVAAQKKREENKSAIICENITRTDRQTLVNLHTKVDKELIKSLHITDKVLKDSINKQLTLSAEQRESLQPSDPMSACSGAITTLQKGKAPTIRENILGHRHPATTAPKVTVTAPTRTTIHPPLVVPVPVPRPHHVTTPNLRRSPVVPAPRVSPPKAQGSPGATPPVALPTPTTTTPAPPVLEPPLVKVPSVKVGPITTPEVTVTTPRL